MCPVLRVAPTDGDKAEKEHDRVVRIDPVIVGGVLVDKPCLQPVMYRSEEGWGGFCVQEVTG